VQLAHGEFRADQASLWLSEVGLGPEQWELAQGDPNRQTTYGDDSRAWAERWQAEGAEWLGVCTQELSDG
jgi:hypothetical protein